LPLQPQREVTGRFHYHDSLAVKCEILVSRTHDIPTLRLQRPHISIVCLSSIDPGYRIHLLEKPWEGTKATLLSFLLS